MTPNKIVAEVVEKYKLVADAKKYKASKEKTEKLGIGANDLKLFALSDSVLKPDFYSTSFLVADSQNQLPVITKEEIKIDQGEEWILWGAIPAIIIDQF